MRMNSGMLMTTQWGKNPPSSTGDTSPCVSKRHGGIIPHMSELDKTRLKAAIKERGESYRSLSLKVGTNDSLVKDILGAKTANPRMDTLQKIAGQLGYPVAYFMKGSDIEPPRPAKPQRSGARPVPIIDWVAAGQLADNVSQLPPESETIEISGLPPGDYFGTKARGDSMNRVAPDDSLLIVNRADRELVRGRRYIFSSRGKTTFKRFGGKDPYRLEPESWNPANEPIYPRDGETWEVIGRVTMVIAEI